ncbi:hypothetical protein D3C78_1194060 [compost metagenome]
MIWPQIDARIGIHAGIARDVFAEIAVTAAAHIETCIAVVIAQLHAPPVFGHATPALTRVFVFQPDIRKKAIGHRAAFTGQDQRQVVCQFWRPFHAPHQRTQILP